MVSNKVFFSTSIMYFCGGSYVGGLSFHNKRKNLNRIVAISMKRNGNKYRFKLTLQSHLRRPIFVVFRALVSIK